MPTLTIQLVWHAVTSSTHPQQLHSQVIRSEKTDKTLKTEDN